MGVYEKTKDVSDEDCAWENRSVNKAKQNARGRSDHKASLPIDKNI